MTTGPRIVMAMKVRDEVDILETNLRYHLAQGVDFFIVIDNGSTDGSLDVLHEWEAAGRLRLIERPDDTFRAREQDWVTEMARLAATDHGGDWVIHSDADEFWWPLRGDLGDALRGISTRYGVVIAPKVNFVARPDGPAPFAERLTAREASTPLAPKIAHRGRADAFVYSGGHVIDTEAARTGRQRYSSQRVFLQHLPESASDPPPPSRDPLVPAPEFPFRVFHFPLRSTAQYEHRLRVYFDSGQQSEVVDRLRSRLEQEGIQALARELTFDEQMVADGIASGELVEDTRLRDFLARMDSGGGSPLPRMAEEELEAERAAVRLEALAGFARSQRMFLYQRDQARDDAAGLRRRLAKSRRASRRRRRSIWRRLRRRIRRLSRR